MNRQGVGWDGEEATPSRAQPQRISYTQDTHTDTDTWLEGNVEWGWKLGGR